MRFEREIFMQKTATPCGIYEVIAMKKICGKEIRLTAKQISIKYQGQHMYVDPELRAVRLCTATNPAYAAKCSPYYVIEPIPIEAYEIKLNTFYAYLRFHPYVRYDFKKYCKELERTTNEVRRV